MTGLTSGIEGLLKKYKVDYLKGSGEIMAAGSVKVHPIDGGEGTTISTKNIVIATGSEPASLPNVQVHVTSNLHPVTTPRKPNQTNQNQTISSD